MAMMASSLSGRRSLGGLGGAEEPVSVPLPCCSWSFIEQMYSRNISIQLQQGWASMLYSVASQYLVINQIFWYLFSRSYKDSDLQLRPISSCEQAEINARGVLPVPSAATLGLQIVATREATPGDGHSHG